MTMRRSRALTPVQRASLAKLAEFIVPAAADMPSASDVALAGAPLDRVLKVRPDLFAPLARLLDSVEGRAGADTLEHLDTSGDPDFEALLQAVLGAYYMHPDVRRMIGYRGQEARALPRAGFGAEDLVAEMMGGHPRYRRVSP
jgi:hypothetical protein